MKMEKDFLNTSKEKYWWIKIKNFCTIRATYTKFIDWENVFVTSKIDKSEVTQLCPPLCDPMDCSLPGFSVHGILQARVLVGWHFLLQGIFLTQGCIWIHRTQQWRRCLSSHREQQRSHRKSGLCCPRRQASWHLDGDSENEKVGSSYSRSIF